MNPLIRVASAVPPNKLAVHFSSDTPEHYTPQHVLRAVHDVFGGLPDLDPCSNSHETPHVAAAHHDTKQDDGLSHPWQGRVFLNPPYGRQLRAWVAKVRAEWARGEVSELIALLPARTDDVVVCFLRGRLRFIGNHNPAPFPSMAVYFGPKHDVFAAVFAELGSLWQRSRRLEQGATSVNRENPQQLTIHPDRGLLERRRLSDGPDA